MPILFAQLTNREAKRLPLQSFDGRRLVHWFHSSDSINSRWIYVQRMLGDKSL